MGRLTRKNDLSSHGSKTIKIIKYPDDDVLHSIAKQHGEIADKVKSSLVRVISSAHYRSDFFCAVMYSRDDEVIGFANFIQSSTEPSKWFYTDLWVASEYRRQGCASEIVTAGLRYLSELCAKTLLCTVDQHNEESLNLQKSLGFRQIETQPFENFEVNADGLIMFRLNVPTNYNIISLTDDLNHLLFICNLLTQPLNASALHLKQIPDNEILAFRMKMREALISDKEEDELNYIIRKGVVPVAWLKINGLSEDNLWISMLVVHDKYRNSGIGMFALNFTEEFALSTGRGHIYINTSADNIIARSLYAKAGYTLVKEEFNQYEDETTLTKLTFHKEILFS